MTSSTIWTAPRILPVLLTAALFASGGCGRQIPTTESGSTDSMVVVLPDSSGGIHDTLVVTPDSEVAVLDTFVTAASAAALTALAERVRRQVELALDVTHVRRAGILLWSDLLAQTIDQGLNKKCSSLVETGLDSTGHTVDSDHDGVPDDYRAVYGPGCTLVTYRGWNATISGSYRFQDLSDSTYGWKVTIDHLIVVQEDPATGFVETTRLDGVETFSTDTVTSVHDMHFQQWYQGSGGGSPSYARGLIGDEHSTTVADDGWRWGQGYSASVAGTLDFNADYRFIRDIDPADADRNFRVVLSTPVPLHFNDQTCGGHGIDGGGALVGQLNGDAGIGFSTSWAGCNTPTVTIVGATP